MRISDCVAATADDSPPTILECPSQGLLPCIHPTLPVEVLTDCARKTARGLAAYDEFAAR